MAGKRNSKIYFYNFYNLVLKDGFRYTRKLDAQPFPNKHSVRSRLGNTGKFFKKLAFIGLALSCLILNKFYLTTMRSIIYSL